MRQRSILLQKLSNNVLVRRIWSLLFLEGDFVRPIVQKPIIKSFLPDAEIGRVLEDGCGRGMYTQYLIDRATEYYGIDVSQSHIDTQKQRRRQTHPAHFQVCSAESLPFEDASFDVVLHTEVLEHVPDDRAAIHEIARVLKAGGLLVLSVPVPPAPILDHEHVREGYSLEDLNMLLNAEGLYIKRVEYCMFGISKALIRFVSLYSRLTTHIPPPSILRWPLYLERFRLPLGHIGLPYDVVVQAYKQ